MKEILNAGLEDTFKKLGLRLGSEAAISITDGDTMAPTGCVITAWDKENKLMFYKAVQKEINGQWVTVDLNAGVKL